MEDGPEVPELRQSRQNKTILQLWWSELTCTIISAASFVAMIVVLHAYVDQPMSHWKLAISLNSVIAILAAVFKAALVFPLTEGLSHLKWIWYTTNKQRPLSDIEAFDNASRDPVASLRLVFTKLVARERPLLAILGATAVVIAVALDPFAQATVEHYSCNRIVADNEAYATALVPRSNVYDPEIATIRSGDTVLDVDAQLAIYKGLLDPSSNSSLGMTGQVQCATVNCTFAHDEHGAAFSTLAISYACADISNTIIHTNKTRKGVLRGNIYSLPSGAQAEVWYMPRSGVQALGVVDATPASYEMVDEGLGALNLMTLEDWPLFTMEAVMVTPQRNCSLAANGTRECENISRSDWEHPSAYSCSLYPSLKTFGADITLGVYREREISSRNLQNLGAVDEEISFAPVPEWQMGTDTFLRNGTWHDCNATDASTTSNTIDIYTARNKTSPECVHSKPGECEDTVPTMWYPPECAWQLSKGTYRLIPELLGQLLHNKTVFSTDDDNPESAEGEPYLRRLFTRSTSPDGEGEGGGIIAFEQFMAGIAAAMSAVVRTRADGTEANTTTAAAGGVVDLNRYAVGETWATEICYSVQWGWLSYLAVLLVMEMVFFGAVVVKTQLSGWDMDWKSSPLVAFFHPLHGGDVTTSECNSTSGAMLASARKINISLVAGTDRWRFRASR
ncbi:hypothetical protein Daus18300_007204 [Diaporthe australafricana]|uniref:Uncharacterized protein n=1 Tax=Diaporthe australafricana TaxID=127596 RepID=A0ABR3WNT1_9PEZI